MRKIIDQKELDCETQFICNDGYTIRADYGFSTGAETGIHNRYDTRTLLTLIDADGEGVESAGFESAQDSEEGAYDWSALDAEIVSYCAVIGWINGDAR